MNKFAIFAATVCMFTASANAKEEAVAVPPVVKMFYLQEVSKESCLYPGKDGVTTVVVSSGGSLCQGNVLYNCESGTWTASREFVNTQKCLQE